MKNDDKKDYVLKQKTTGMFVHGNHKLFVYKKTVKGAVRFTKKQVKMIVSATNGLEVFKIVKKKK